MGTALLALCFCALSLVLALFVGISPISDKAKVRFMYVGAALSLMAVPMMSHYIAGLNDIVDELRYQAVLVFIFVVCCYCFVMANMVKYNVFTLLLGWVGVLCPMSFFQMLNLSSSDAQSVFFKFQRPHL